MMISSSPVRHLLGVITAKRIYMSRGYVGDVDLPG